MTGTVAPTLPGSPVRPSSLWAEEIAGDLEAGATWVLAEGRESGTVGLYHSDGRVREELVDALGSAIGLRSLVFEAPRPAQQGWLLRRQTRKAGGPVLEFDLLLEGDVVGEQQDVEPGCEGHRALGGKDTERLVLAAARAAVTTDLSAALLRWAARGQTIEPVHSLLGAIAARERAAAAAAVTRVCSVGASSGADLLLGLALGLDPRVDAGESVADRPCRARVIDDRRRS